MNTHTPTHTHTKCVYTKNRHSFKLTRDWTGEETKTFQEEVIVLFLRIRKKGDLLPKTFESALGIDYNLQSQRAKQNQRVTFVSCGTSTLKSGKGSTTIFLF